MCLSFVAVKIFVVFSLIESLPHKIPNHYTNLIKSLELLIDALCNTQKLWLPATPNAWLIIEQQRWADNLLYY